MHAMHEHTHTHTHTHAHTRKQNSNNNNNNNNNNNYYLPTRGPLGEGFFPQILGGSFSLAILPTPALPYPSYPALCREDTTHSWSSDDR